MELAPVSDEAVELDAAMQWGAARVEAARVSGEAAESVAPLRSGEASVLD